MHASPFYFYFFFVCCPCKLTVMVFFTNWILWFLRLLLEHVCELLLPKNISFRLLSSIIWIIFHSLSSSWLTKLSSDSDLLHVQQGSTYCPVKQSPDSNFFFVNRFHHICSAHSSHINIGFSDADRIGLFQTSCVFVSGCIGWNKNKSSSLEIW